MEFVHNGKAVLVSFTDKVDREFLIKYPDLKVVGSNTTGNEHIDYKACEERVVHIITLGLQPNRDEETEKFLNTISSTAEHTIGLMIAVSRKYNTAFNGVSSVGHKLAGKTLGLIGYGRIARQVKKIAEAMGMEVLWVDKDNRICSLEELLNCDFVSLHIPLELNEGCFNKKMFKQMKPTSFFINTSRDGVIERGALRWALENKVIAGAAIDFSDSLDLVQYSQEHDNLIITPHIGGATIEDRELTKNFILKKIDEYLCQVSK